MKNLLLILLCFPLLLFSQEEKRLALVIGNANYDEYPLKNPVNDALLMSSTLNSLGFEVILATNIADERSFTEKIREFGKKRPDYDIAFVYYAGHGMQIDGENYLIPTKEVFESKYDVQEYGVSVKHIMKYLDEITDQVNILILDACRDNPFESNMNKKRSFKGNGLAQMIPPTGSLIAFSTASGETADDGDGENSIYCKHLCNNMMKKNINIETVFKNVRSELHILGQYPTENYQLTGGELILNYDSDFELDDIENTVWSGTYRQHLESMKNLTLLEGSYPIDLTITNFSDGEISAVIDYPTLHCSGFLILQEKSSNDRYLFVERLTENVDGGCISDGQVTIELVDENTMLFYWYYGNDYYFDNTVYRLPIGHMGAACILKKQ